MRIFITVLVLIFSIQSLTKADDIRDFQIEGISIGDSALDFFSENEILSNIREDAYEGSDGKFYDIFLIKEPSEMYEKVSMAFKKNDKKYIIYSLGGLIFFGEDTENCISTYKNIAKEVENLFPDHEKYIRKNKTHPQDKTGKSFSNATTFIHESGSGAEVACYTWSKEMKIQDYVLVAIDSSEFGKWLDAYYDN